MSKNLIKGLVMTLISIVGAAVSTTPTTIAGWEVFAITSSGTILTYIAKNAFYPSNSALGTINYKDLISGAILAVGTALSSFTASAIIGTHVDFVAVLKLVATVVFGYLVKNYSTNSLPTIAIPNDKV